MIKNIFTSIKRLLSYNPLKEIDQINLSVQKQKTILHKYNKKNMNLIERSYAQYRCQMELLQVHQRILLHLIGCLYICLSLFLLLKQKPKKKQKTDAVISCDDNILPTILKNNNTTSKMIYKKALLLKDIPLFVKIFLKYPLDSYFLAKIIYKISLYRYNILTFDNKRFIVTSEYSFTSSVGTYFCHLNNIEHINTMHGEKYFFIGDSYFQFDKCYIWEEHYKSLFIKLLAKEDQFVIALPSIFEKLKEEKEEKSSQNTLTYYLQNETYEELESIHKVCEQLNIHFTVFIRPHPIYSDINAIKKLFPLKMIQTNKTDIYTSIQQTHYVVSKFSTVLYIASLLEKSIILDDISVDIQFYNNLKKLDYIIMEKKHTYLSKFLQSLDNG